MKELQPRYDQAQFNPETEKGSPGVLPQGEPAKPQQERGERKRRPYLVYNPKKETLEEYRIRYDQEHVRREIEQAEQREKRLKYQREYQKRRRKRLKEQRQAASAEEAREQPAEAIQILALPEFP
jgi:hypothetical protein